MFRSPMPVSLSPSGGVGKVLIGSEARSSQFVSATENGFAKRNQN